MKRILLLLFILFLLSCDLSFAKERRLQGQVMILEESHERVPPRNTEVVISEINTSEPTDDNGRFAHFLRDIDRPNQDIKFLVKVEGYVIQDPLDGNTRIPKDSELYKLIRLLLVKKGSPDILSAARFEKSVEEATVKAKDQVKLGKDEQRVPIELKVEEVAAKLGFSEEVFRRWILEKAAEQERSQNPKARARAAAAKGEFNKAGDLQMQATERLAEAYARARPKKQQGPWPIDHAIPRLVKDSSPLVAEDLEQLALELVKGFRFAGDAYYNAYEFEKALTAYKRALQYVSKEDSAELWAAIQVDIGLASAAIGRQTQGAAIHQHLAEAVTAYRVALTVYTKEELPQQWARTQMNLGLVLWSQGTRISGEAGRRLLAAAVTAHRKALTVYTKEELPQQWAVTQTNLGNVLQRQGRRISGEADTRLLAEAVAAYHAALTVQTKEQFPQLWAGTQNNLGLVLWSQGTRTSGEAGKALIRQAINAFESALEVRTREALPVQWEQTTGNLSLTKKALEDMK